MQIYIQKGSERLGPYTLEQVNECLAQDSLQATDPAWHKGLADWCPLDQIDGVVVADSSSPPPFDPNTFESTGRPQKPSNSEVQPGTVLWEFETGDSVSSSPAIGSDGTVYVG